MPIGLKHIDRGEMGYFRITYTYFDGTTTDRVHYCTLGQAQELADDMLRFENNSSRPIIVAAKIDMCEKKRPCVYLDKAV